MDRHERKGRAASIAAFVLEGCITSGLADDALKDECSPQASDFEYIYNPDGTCHFWYCGKPGVVLVYDDFSPEGGLWFCEECWNDFQGDDANWLTIVEDRRHTLPALIEQYRAIATILARHPDTLPRLLAADYRFIAELLIVAIGRGTVAMLVRELRGNLNRRASYIHSVKRNKTLQVAARTIERLEGKR